MEYLYAQRLMYASEGWRMRNILVWGKRSHSAKETAATILVSPENHKAVESAFFMSTLVYGSVNLQ